jgi:hypothetical protein
MLNPKPISKKSMINNRIIITPHFLRKKDWRTQPVKHAKYVSMPMSNPGYVNAFYRVAGKSQAE